jgi:hypothetical protein
VTFNDLNSILVKYIEDNKVKNDIDYMESIESLEELLKEIKKDYKELEEK